MKREDIKTAKQVFREMLLKDNGATSTEMMVEYAKQFIDLADSEARRNCLNGFATGNVYDDIILNIKELMI